MCLSIIRINIKINSSFLKINYDSDKNYNFYNK